MSSVKKPKNKGGFKPLSAEFELYPVVALVGRVNVGKSTLFNTLLEQKKAVVSPAPKTTRDVNHGVCHWRGVNFVLVDTGGFTGTSATEMDKQVERQAERLVQTADLLVFVVDSREGLSPDDRAFLKRIRSLTKTPIIFAANKADQKTAAENHEWSEWQKLGLGSPMRVAAVSGRGTGDLLDVIVEQLPKPEEKAEEEEKEELRIAIVGRTNVGKSSLLNQILGEERVIVSPQPHTTREPQDTLLEYEGVSMRIIDTVGMRRKSKISSRIDREGFIRSIKTIEQSDIVIIVLESTVTPSKQESRLLSIAKDSGAGVMIIVNKWDLVEGKNTKSAKTYEDFFKGFFKTAPWIPVLFVSALSGQRVQKIVDSIMAIRNERLKNIEQEQLDILLKRSIASQPPQWIRGRKKPVVRQFTQEGTNPPAFGLWVNDPTTISYAYLRFLEHRLRDEFGFHGTPVKVYTKEHRPVKVKHKP